MTIQDSGRELNWPCNRRTAETAASRSLCRPRQADDSMVAFVLGRGDAMFPTQGGVILAVARSTYPGLYCLNAFSVEKRAFGIHHLDAKSTDELYRVRNAAKRWGQIWFLVFRRFEIASTKQK